MLLSGGGKNLPHKQLSWNYLYAGLCMNGAAFFIFRD
jgi:uncharacterized protein (DUF486 family)